MVDYIDVLPAYAGMIRLGSGFRRGGRGAPRVCGDDPDAMMMLGIQAACSPRMRG